MKILIITDAWHPQVNGVVRTYEHLIEELKKKGCTIRVIGPADFPRRMPMPGYKEIELTIAPYNQLKKMIETYNPDRIHISVEGPLGWAGRKYCLKHGKKFTTSYHTQFPSYIAKRLAKHMPFLYGFVHEQAKKLVRHFHAPAHAMMVATQSLEAQLKSWAFKTPVYRMTRGVKLEYFYPGEKTLFQDLKRPVALYVGRIAIEKSIEDFLEMDWNGSKVVVGDGPSMKTLQQKYPKAIFTGTKTGEELAEHYRSADLFVFPSRTDTFGMVIVEAMACGLPVAGYDVTGPKDIITEPGLGALHKDNLALAAREALKTGIAEKCSDHARVHYTWEKAAEQFLKPFISVKSE